MQKQVFGGNDTILEESFIFDIAVFKDKTLSGIFTSDIGTLPITLDSETGRYGFTLTGTLE